jgi:hypothetical protein
VQDGQAQWEIAQTLLRLMAGRATGAEALRPYFLAHLATTFRPYLWARACFRHALNPARAQQAKALELWPVISLNWLRQRRAKWNYGTRSIGGAPRLIPRGLWHGTPAQGQGPASIAVMMRPGVALVLRGNQMNGYRHPWGAWQS